MAEISDYRHILKATSVFGGVQAIQIIASIIKGKLVAVLLGPVGVGLNSIFNSVINMVAEFANCGLNFSAVRTLSQATEQHNNIDRVLYIFNRWILYCAIIGAFILIIAAPIISSISFDNKAYTYSFMWLSLAVVAIIFNKSRLTILQGTRQLTRLAKASLLSSLIGVIIIVPVYMLYGVQGIVPAIIVSALVSCSISWSMSRRPRSHIKISGREIFCEGREMATLGISLMFANIMGLASTYLLNAYITVMGNLSDVGLYQGAISITNQSVGMVFTAMSVDLFPRLSAVCHDNSKIKAIVNQQAEISILCVVALFGAMILFTPLVIHILLSKEFTPIIPVVRWLLIGMLFRAAAYPVGTISFSKGDKKIFFLFEGVFTTLINFLGSAVGYTLYNLKGLAIGFVCSNLIYLFLILIITNRRYQFSFNSTFFRLYLKLFILSIAMFLCATYLTSYWFYTCGFIIFGYLLYLIYRELNRRIQIKDLWMSWFQKRGLKS